jgi:hypothetical protein
VTSEGCATLSKIVAARRDHLAGLSAEWEPSRKEEDLTVLLRRLADELIPDPQLRSIA